jgi:peroxiredoxin/GNAT superfamily N-acetyltransferase
MREIYLAAAREAWCHFLPVDELRPDADAFTGGDGFVVEDDGEIVGFACMRGDELAMLYTLPLIWGRGAGRALMDRALAGHTVVTLWTAEQNTRARTVYERYGWRVDGTTRTKTYAGVTFTELRYAFEVSLDPYLLPPNLPVPEDDGAADHLSGARIPALVLDSSQGPVDLAELCAQRAVLYVYPRTGKPGVPSLPGWDDVPGARGCTPQSCAFRDHAGELAELGARVAGLSAQSLKDQREFAERNHLPYPVLSDPELRLHDELGLPTFEIAGHTLYKRLALIAEGGVVSEVFYPVFPPDRNAADVVAALRATVS